MKYLDYAMYFFIILAILAGIMGLFLG